MRDWLISRQRYWGAPIPIIHCPKDGIVSVPEDQLPVQLPELKKFEPSGDGRSPLANVPEFVNVTCPVCGGPAERETDTMDGFACSSWYFLRFADPHNNEKAFDADKVKFWLPVDDYIGGAEHAVMHLLYARMWTKVMQDAGLIEFGEPFKSLRNQGMILAPDGQKMSKSKGNTIQPDELIEQGYGADAIRIMEMFIGPWNQSANWSVEGLGGSYRFLQRVWNLVQDQISTTQTKDGSSEQLKRAVHRTVKKVSEDLAEMGFNTAIAALMELTNELYKMKRDLQMGTLAWRESLEMTLQLLAPFAPHMTEELWHQLGHTDSIHVSVWPIYDEQYLTVDSVTIAVQVNGKLRGTVEVPTDSDEASITEKAKADEKIASYLMDKEIVKSVYVPGKLLSFVVR
jgi:leucyl-tRNA synthetase